MTLSERNAIALQAYFDEGHLELPREYVEANTCGLYLTGYILAAFSGAIIGIAGTLAAVWL